MTERDPDRFDDITPESVEGVVWATVWGLLSVYLKTFGWVFLVYGLIGLGLAAVMTIF